MLYEQKINITIKKENELPSGNGRDDKLQSVRVYLHTQLSLSKCINKNFIEILVYLEVKTISNVYLMLR